MLKVGDAAFDFSALSSTGQRVALRALRGKKLVLYFFLRTIWVSRGCHQEAQRFRDNYPDIRELGAEVIGVSTDKHDNTCKFALHHQVTFPLVADEDRSISRGYGVLRAFVPVDQRVTFVIDEAGIIGAVFQHEFQVSKHLDEVLRFLRKARGI